ncbi:Uncharacterized protein DAT39_017745, partial [Clarias magur]
NISRLKLGTSGVLLENPIDQVQPALLLPVLNDAQNIRLILLGRAALYRIVTYRQKIWIWIFHDSCVGRMRCQAQRCRTRLKVTRQRFGTEPAQSEAEHYRGIACCQERCQALQTPKQHYPRPAIRNLWSGSDKRVQVKNDRKKERKGKKGKLQRVAEGNATSSCFLLFPCPLGFSLARLGVLLFSNISPNTCLRSAGLSTTELCVCFPSLIFSFVP